MCRCKGISALWRRQKIVKNRQPGSPRILHHTQRRRLCLLHALNNLFQVDATFTQCELDGIARGLAKEGVLQDSAGCFSCLFNPHYNILTGNYDVHVLVRAVQMKGAYVKWYTRGEEIDFSDPLFIGFIWNYPSGGHWSALKKIGNFWYDLDSNLAEPFCVGDSDDHVMRFLLGEGLIVFQVFKK